MEEYNNHAVHSDKQKTKQMERESYTAEIKVPQNVNVTLRMIYVQGMYRSWYDDRNSRKGHCSKVLVIYYPLNFFLRIV